MPPSFSSAPAPRWPAARAAATAATAPRRAPRRRPRASQARTPRSSGSLVVGALGAPLRRVPARDPRARREQRRRRPVRRARDPRRRRRRRRRRRAAGSRALVAGRIATARGVVDSSSRSSRRRATRGTCVRRAYAPPPASSTSPVGSARPGDLRLRRGAGLCWRSGRGGGGTCTRSCDVTGRTTTRGNWPGHAINLGGVPPGVTGQASSKHTANREHSQARVRVPNLNPAFERRYQWPSQLRKLRRV